MALRRFRARSAFHSELVSQLSQERGRGREIKLSNIYIYIFSYLITTITHEQLMSRDCYWCSPLSKLWLHNNSNMNTDMDMAVHLPMCRSASACSRCLLLPPLRTWVPLRLFSLLLLLWSLERRQCMSARRRLRPHLRWRNSSLTVARLNKTHRTSRCCSGCSPTRTSLISYSLWLTTTTTTSRLVSSSSSSFPNATYHCTHFFWNMLYVYIDTNLRDTDFFLRTCWWMDGLMDWLIDWWPILQESLGWWRWCPIDQPLMAQSLHTGFSFLVA